MLPFVFAFAFWRALWVSVLLTELVGGNCALAAPSGSLPSSPLWCSLAPGAHKSKSHWRHPIMLVPVCITLLHELQKKPAFSVWKALRLWLHPPVAAEACRPAATAAKAVAAVGLQDGIVLGGSVGRGGGARAKGEGVVKLEPSDFQRMLSSSARDEEKQEKQDRYFFTNKNGRFVSAVPKVMLPKNQK